MNLIVPPPMFFCASFVALMIDRFSEFNELSLVCSCLSPESRAGGVGAVPPGAGRPVPQLPPHRHHDLHRPAQRDGVGDRVHRTRCDRSISTLSSNAERDLTRDFRVSWMRAFSALSISTLNWGVEFGFLLVYFLSRACIFIYSPSRSIHSPSGLGFSTRPAER